MNVFVDFQAVKEVCIQGVRRTSVFMGLGVNAALDPDFKKYQLLDVTPIQFLPSDVNEDTLRRFKSEFCTWVVASGLRELIETFAVFLDHVHYSCMLLSFHGKRIDVAELFSKNKKFCRDGVKDKITALKDAFGIAPAHPDMLLSINQARHCLVHRRGLVARQDCAGGDMLSVKWPGFDLYMAHTNGQETPIPLPMKQGMVLQGPGSINVRSTVRSRDFAIGTLVTFSPAELSEICHFAIVAADEVISSAVNYAQQMGIPFKDSMPLDGNGRKLAEN